MTPAGSVAAVGLDLARAAMLVAYPGLQITESSASDPDEPSSDETSTVSEPTPIGE